MIFSDDRTSKDALLNTLGDELAAAWARFYAIEVDSRRANLSTIGRSPWPRNWRPRSSRSSRQPEDGLRATGPFEFWRLGNFPFWREARLQGSPREGPELRARSLSDAGNDWIVDGHTDPVSPYYQGHFSNGLTWVEDLSTMLGLGTLKPSLAGGKDFAFGGAETGPTAIEGVNPGDLLFQVAQ